MVRQLKDGDRERDDAGAAVARKTCHLGISWRSSESVLHCVDAKTQARSRDKSQIYILATSQRATWCQRQRLLLPIFWKRLAGRHKGFSFSSLLSLFRSIDIIIRPKTALMFASTSQ